MQHFFSLQPLEALGTGQLVTTDMEYHPVPLAALQPLPYIFSFQSSSRRIVSSYNTCITLGGLAVLLTPPLVSSKKQILKNDSLILIKEELYFLTLHDKTSLFKGLCLNWHLNLDVSVTQQVLQITNLLQYKLVYIPVHSQILLLGIAKHTMHPTNCAGEHI